MEIHTRGSVHVPGCFCFGVVAPLDLEVLDGAASSTTLDFVQDTDRSLVISEVRLQINGLVVDVLIKICTVRRLKALPKL